MPFPANRYGRAFRRCPCSRGTRRVVQRVAMHKRFQRARARGGVTAVRMCHTVDDTRSVTSVIQPVAVVSVRGSALRGRFVGFAFRINLQPGRAFHDNKRVALKTALHPVLQPEPVPASQTNGFADNAEFADYGGLRAVVAGHAHLGVLGQQRKAFVIEIVPVLAAHRGRTFEHERSLDVGPREEWRIRSTHWFSMSGASSRRTHAGARFGEGESPGGGRLGRAPCSDARRVRNRTSPRAETNHGT
mmetsp:Transcript_802/g.2702  ORF Transcript_802/g.2702 Transcript_802/m.2702 type:complete len:246 (+) Transcript_802:1728-2465(+)